MFVCASLILKLLQVNNVFLFLPASMKFISCKCYQGASAIKLELDKEFSFADAATESAFLTQKTCA